METTSFWEKHGPQIILLVIVLAAGTYYFSSNGEVGNNALKVAFPYTQSVAANTSFACSSLVSTSVIGSAEEYLTNGIEGTVEKGTDKVAMEIKNEETLILTTAASVEAGITEGDQFTILQNTPEQLMAVWMNENVISTVVLNKKNGLAIWSKANPDFLTYASPYGSAIYMQCL